MASFRQRNGKWQARVFREGYPDCDFRLSCQGRFDAGLGQQYLVTIRFKGGRVFIWLVCFLGLFHNGIGLKTFVFLRLRGVGHIDRVLIGNHLANDLMIFTFHLPVT